MIVAVLIGLLVDVVMVGAVVGRWIVGDEYALLLAAGVLEKDVGAEVAINVAADERGIGRQVDQLVVVVAVAVGLLMDVVVDAVG